MRENLSTNFRYTKAAGRYAFLALGVVPGLLLFGAYKFAVSTARPLSFRITTRGPFLTVFFFFFFCLGPTRLCRQAPQRVRLETALSVRKPAGGFLFPRNLFSLTTHYSNISLSRPHLFFFTHPLSYDK